MLIDLMASCLSVEEENGSKTAPLEISIRMHFWSSAGVALIALIAPEAN